MKERKKQAETRGLVWNIQLLRENRNFLPLLLALAFLASCARVAAIKLSWANSCTRRNHGVLLSVLS